MTGPDGETHLYAYDIKHNLWTIEGVDGEGTYTTMLNHDNQLHAIRVSDDVGSLLYFEPGIVYPTVQWYCEFVPFYEDVFNRKGYLRLLIRMDMTSGSSVTVKVKEDERTWKTVWEQTAVNDVPVMVPLRLGRCDKFTLRIEGVGEVVIRAVGREYVTGSVIN